YPYLKTEHSDVFFVHAYITDSNGTVIPDYAGEVTFSLTGDAVFIGKNPATCSAGIASIIMKTSANINDVKISATVSDLFTLAKEYKNAPIVSYDKTIDSLPLIPKLFLEHQSKSEGFCIVQGNISKKQVALTFDDGPTDLSGEIIEILNKYDAKGTFFWLGKNLKEKTNIINLAKENGHLIANHSWDHQNGWELTAENIWNTQIEKTFKELALNGVNKSKYFRPPYGAITQNQIDFLAKKGIKTVLWSITTMDWDKTQNSEDEIFEKFKSSLHNGAVVLLHDFDFTNSNAQVKALEKIIVYGKSLGYTFVTVDEILN
ncbi:MAG TPA: polysaccharide deacetylase family protein, partial [Lutibacter sp.]|nr:polysaccharide deacetylase family protein [Lutibacter sp.]